MTERFRRDEGHTILELSTVLSLLGIVLAALLTFLASTQSNLERNISRSDSNDEVRLAIQSLDREVRSGNVLYDPSLEVYAPGDIASAMSVRVYTQSNGAFKCVQWRVTSSTAELQRRDWDPNTGTLGHDWRTVATGIRNRQSDLRDAGGNLVSTAEKAAFSLPQTNLLQVHLWSNSDPNAKKSKPVDVKVSVSGRNTIFYSANQLCGPVPPDPSTSNIPPY
jgi:type II secretory pathway pseudopilin PulG